MYERLQKLSLGLLHGVTISLMKHFGDGHDSLVKDWMDKLIHSEVVESYLIGLGLRLGGGVILCHTFDTLTIKHEVAMQLRGRYLFFF